MVLVGASSPWFCLSASICTGRSSVHEKLSTRVRGADGESVDSNKKKSRRVACSLEPWHVRITCGSAWFKYFSLNEQWEGGQPGPGKPVHPRIIITDETKQQLSNVNARKILQKLQLARRIQRRRGSYDVVCHEANYFFPILLSINDEHELVWWLRVRATQLLRWFGLFNFLLRQEKEC